MSYSELGMLHPQFYELQKDFETEPMVLTTALDFDRAQHLLLQQPRSLLSQVGQKHLSSEAQLLHHQKLDHLLLGLLYVVMVHN